MLITCPLIRDDWTPGASFVPTVARYFIADTEAERPATGAMADLCFTKDTKKLWKWHDSQWNDSAGASQPGGAHTHPIGEIVSLQSALDSKAASAHVHPPAPQDVAILPNSMAWTNQPAADTELLGAAGLCRFKVNLTGYTEYRWMVSVTTPGVAGADLRLQYSLDDAAYADLSTELDIGTTGRKISNWASLTANARADVWIRIMGKQGNATADPAFGGMRLQVR